MKPENHIPALKMLEFKGLRNPLTNEGMRALAIVLGVIVVIAGVVYATNFGKKRDSTVVPTKTLEEVKVTSQPIVTPLIEAATSSASPSSTKKIQRPTSTPTPTP